MKKHNLCQNIVSKLVGKLNGYLEILAFLELKKFLDNICPFKQRINLEKKEKVLGATDSGPLEKSSAAPAKRNVNIGLNS